MEKRTLTKTQIDRKAQQQKISIEETVQLQRVANKKKIFNKSEKAVPYIAKTSTVIANALSRIVYTIRLIRSKKWYNYSYLSLTVLLVICMMLQSTDPANKISNISKTLQYCCHSGFVLFVVIRLCSLEPIHLGWCFAECTAFVTGLSTIFVTNEEVAPYLHAASCLRAVIIVRTTSLFIPFSSFISAFKNVSRVVIPAIILIYQFCIVGYFVFSHTSSKSLNSQYKMMSYQNILYSFYNSYKMVFVVGWSQVSYFQRQEVNPIFVFVYYIIFIYFVSYIYMNIFYGTMMANQQDLIPQVKKVSLNLFDQIYIENEDGNINNLRISNKIGIKKTNSMKDLIYYLTINPKLKNQLLMAIIKKPKPITDIFLFDQIKKQQTESKIQQSVVFLTKTFYLPDNVKFKFFCQKMQQIYQGIDILIIVVGCLNMCISTQQYNIGKNEKRNIIDLICTIWLFLNVFVKLLCHQVKQFKLAKWCQQNKVQVPISLMQLDFQLKFQIVIAILVGGGIFHETTIASIKPILSYPKDKIGRLLRCIKYARICKIFIHKCQFASIKKTRLIILSIIKIIKKLLPYFVFFILMVILFSLIGYNLFNKGDQTNFDHQFSSVFRSFIYVFMIFNNQCHDSILSEQYPIHGVLIIVYHIIALTIGNAILIKYFMTLFLTQLFQELQHTELQLDHEKQKTIDNKIMPIQNQQYFSENNTLQNQLENKNHVKNHSQQKQYFSQENCENSSSFIIKLKQKGKIFINSFYYLAFHFVVTIISVIQAAHRGPLMDRSSKLFLIFQKVQLICAIYFIIELTFNLFCFGIYHNDSAYFKKNKTGIITLLIAIICSLCFIPSLAETQVVFKLCKLKILRMFTTLELAANKCYRMKLTLIGFIRLLPKTLLFLIVFAVYYGFCAILLVSLYEQQGYQCVNFANNSTIDNIKDCFYWGGDWVEVALSTNTSLAAFLNLLAISLTQSWNDFITNISQIRGHNLQPQTNANNEMYLLSVYGYLSGSFLILNLFSGFLLYHMNKIMQEQSGECKLNKFQMNWLCIRQQINRIVLIPKNQFTRFSLRYYFNIISNAQIYKVCKICYIISLLIFLSLPNFSHSAQSKKYFSIIYASYFFSSMILTIIERLGEKFKVRLFIIVFDVILYSYAIVYFSYIFIQNQENYSKDVLIIGAILTGMQLFQYWQYFVKFQIVQKTLKYLYIILPRALFILIPMLIMLIVYTFIALQLFPYLKLSNSNKSNLFSYNYSTFFDAFQSLMRFLTQSQITQIIDTSFNLSPNSICFQIRNYNDYLKYGANGCGSKIVSFLFFLSFHIIYSLIMSTALMANIFDSYIQVKKRQHIVIHEFQIQKVTNQWLKFDSNATGFLPIHRFWLFTTQLYDIYGLTQKRNVTFQFKYQFLKNLNINLYKNQETLMFQFYQTIQELTKLLLCKKHRKPFNRNNADLIFQKINDTSVRKDKQLQKTNFTSKDVIAIIALKKGLNNWRNKIIYRKKHLNMNYQVIYRKICKENVKNTIKIEQSIQKQ